MAWLMPRGEPGCRERGRSVRKLQAGTANPGARVTAAAEGLPASPAGSVLQQRAAVMTAASVCGLAAGVAAAGSKNRGNRAGNSGLTMGRYGALLLLLTLVGVQLAVVQAVTGPRHDLDVMAGALLDTPEDVPAQARRSNDTSEPGALLSAARRKQQLQTGAGAQQGARHLLQQTYEGVTDADQSPGLPDYFVSQEDRLNKLDKNMMKQLEISAEKQESLDKQVKKVQEQIHSDVSDVLDDVQYENKLDTDAINEIPPTPGIPGPPGPAGLNGHNGKDGAPGKEGQKGQTGPHGIPGGTGIIGKVGGLGPEGKTGKPGLQGVQGIEGIQGGEGIPGIEGETNEWHASKYFCPEAATNTMRLTGCDRHACRLEVKFEHEWGSVCSDGFTEQSADTLCRAFGFPSGGRMFKGFGGGKGLIWLTQVRCEGDEGDAADCPHSPWGTESCGHGSDVGMCCYGGHPEGKIGVRKSSSTFPRCPGRSTKDMRLVDCNKEVCRLEVRHNGEWGTVCDNGFTTTSAQTVCKMFGYPQGKFKQMCASQGLYGACAANVKGKGPIWLDNVVCAGFERDLEGCRHSPWGEHRCTHKQDVGICCSGDFGDIVKPGKCRGGRLKYKFNENLRSSSGGPDLMAPWGGAFAGVEGYKFKEGQGLAVDPNGCLDADHYTLYMRVKLDSMSGKRMLLRSNGWADAGFMIKDNHFTANPNNFNGTLWCEERLFPRKWIQYVVSRDAQGEIRLYLNGALCGVGKAEEPGTFVLNPHDVQFFSDQSMRNPTGYVNKLALYEKVLSEDKVAKICGCKLPVRDKICKRHITVNAALFGIKYSSTYSRSWSYCAREGGMCRCPDGTVRYGANGQYKYTSTRSTIRCDNSLGDPIVGVRKACYCKPSSKFGKGYSAGRLNSPQAWTAAASRTGEWMQMDTGMIQSISGIVTQGRRDRNEWITSYTVKVSTDGKNWIDVACGRVFKGNSNRNSKVKRWFHEPVHARFVRVYPQTWRSRLSLRAGVLVCERPCVGGQLNYLFGMSFMSSSGGPSLDPFWGEGTFKEVDIATKPTVVYQFKAGEGLQIDQSRCLKKSHEYTILIDVKLDSTTGGYKKILGSMGWGDYGLYVKKNLMLIPTSTKMRCKETIRNTKFYKFVMSRDGSGKVKIYINGGLCAEGDPVFKQHYLLNPNNILIMKDDADENAGGQLKNVHIWDRALADEEVLSFCGCSKPDPGEKCKFTVAFLPPSSRASYSSVRNNDRKGKGYARGRLGSDQGWVSKFATPGQYMQLDTGMVQSIVGVITQGRRDRNEWVKSFTVQVSQDGADWQDVGCGTEFDANSNRNTKIKNYFENPVRGRYVRIFPQTWQGWMSMRAGLLICEKPCIEERLDYNFAGTFASRSFGPSLDPAWGDGLFSLRRGYRFEKGMGFELDASRCLKKTKGWTVTMNVRLDSTSGPKALMTSYTWGLDHGLYVDRYLMLGPSGANMVCEERPIRPRTWYKLAMTRLDDGNITLFVNGAPCSMGSPGFKHHYTLNTKDIQFLRDNKGQDPSGYVKSIRMWNKGMTDEEVAVQCGCLLPEGAGERCKQRIAFSPTYKQILYSSVWNKDMMGTGCGRGRLNSRGGWCPKRRVAGEWMQIDTGDVQTISGVITQGRRDWSQWVKSFTVKVSEDGLQWKDVECQRAYKGNSNRNSKVRTIFRDPVRGRYVRIYPQSWHGWPSMRAGVMVCEYPCQGGQLWYNLAKGSFLSKTKGNALTAPWGDGYFDGDNGYRFGHNKGLFLDSDNEGCMNDHRPKNVSEANPNTEYSILMKVKLDSTYGWRRLLYSTGWGDYGLFVNRKFQMFPIGANLKCAQTLHRRKWYNLGMTRSPDGEVALYLNGAQCARGSPSFLKGYEIDFNKLEFFHDKSGQTTGGNLKDLHVWNKALTREEMAAEVGCHLTTEAKRCPRNIIFGAMTRQTVYSSVWQNDRPGIGLGRGRLNSPQAWCPATATAGVEYMQVDTGEVQSLSGIVTQGRRDYGQWVREFYVHVSDDGLTWTPVACGEVFDANKNQNSKVKTFFRRPVKARYVRIFPQRWRNWPCMRMGVMICERPCVNKKLDYRFNYNFLSASKGPSLDPAWGEGTFYAQNVGYYFSHNNGLMVDESNCINNPENYTIFVEAKLNHIHGWKKIFGSDTWGEYGMYVNKQFQLFPEASNMKCLERLDHGHYYKFMMSRKSDGEVKLYLNGYMCASGYPAYVSGYMPNPTSLEFFHSESGQASSGYVKRITVWGRTLTDDEAAAESECRLSTLAAKCNGTVTLNAPYSRHEYSSTQWYARKGRSDAQGRLGSRQAWCAGHGQFEGSWFQIDVGSVQRIAGVVTQGRYNTNQRVTSYKVMVSSDGLKWTDVQCGSVFEGNNDRNTKVKNVFDQPTVARYVRIFPQTYQYWMCMRAGVLLCEKPCLNDQLDYQLLDTLMSVTKGPNLIPKWGDGQYNTAGYRIAGGKGFLLDESNCLKKTKAWTIYMNVKFDHVSHRYIRLLNSGWGDYGLYLLKGRDSHYGFYPPGASMECAEPIRRNVYYKYAVTRNEEGDMALYINGYKCASGSPPYYDAFALDPAKIEFYHDDGSENGWGYAKRIRVWARQLSDSEVASVSGCRLLKQLKKCNTTSAYSPPYDQIKYSSVWARDAIGYRHGRGRLNSPQAWSAQFNREGEFMTMDMGSKMKISGVVTQGRRDYWQMVTAFKVLVSDDGKKWRYVQCGQVFTGNKDRHTKVKNFFDAPVEARYVRISVIRWTNHISMRAGVLLCDEHCLNGELKYTLQRSFLSVSKGPSLKAVWGEGRWDNTRGYRFESGRGLQLNEGACIMKGAWTLLMNVRLDHTHRYVRILNSAGWGDYGLYVHRSRLMMYPSSTGVKCEHDVLRPGVYWNIGISRSVKGKICLYVNGYKCDCGKPSVLNHFKLDPHDTTIMRDDGSENSGGYLKMVRMWDKVLPEGKMATLAGVELPEETKKCENTIVYNAPYSRHTYSSTWSNDRVGYRYARGRLGSPYTWHPRVNNGWMQIDLKKVQPVAGIATQGRNDYWQWTTSYKVEVSQDGDEWYAVQGGVPFPGNNNRHSTVKNYFDAPVKARYVKITPVTYYGWPCMRAAIILCEVPCKTGELDYPLVDSFTSVTDGPMLEEGWGGGHFHRHGNNIGYRYYRNRGLTLKPGTCITTTDSYSLLLEVKLDNAHTWNRLVASEGWRRAGLFVKDRKYSLMPLDLEITCPGTIFSHRIYKFGMTRDKKDQVKLYLNGWMCAEGPVNDAPKKLALDPENVDFFHDANGHDYSGTVSRIRLWNKALTEADMQKASGCRPPQHASGSCKGLIVTNVPYSRIRSDAAYGNDRAGYRYNRGRLNSAGNWMPPNGRRGHWIQFMLKEVQAVAGVVTQGSGRNNWYTTSFYVKVSQDGRKWRKVECGRIYDGNKDRNTKLRTVFEKAVKAKYVRIYPVTYYGWPAIRAGILVCEKKCKNTILDYSFRDTLGSRTGGPMLEAAWGDGRFTKTHGYRFHKDEGLQLDQSNCVKQQKKWSVLINARLDQVTPFKNLMTSEDWSDAGLYVNEKYMLKPSGMECAETIRNRYFYKFGITRNAKGQVTLFLNGYPCVTGKPKSASGFELMENNIIFFRGLQSQSTSGYVKQIKIWGKALSDSDMTAESGCNLPKMLAKCKRNIIKIPSMNRYRASSQWHGMIGDWYGRANLNAHGGWWARQRNRKQWLQMDMGKAVSVAGVVTQGYRYGSYWVKTFKVSVSEDAYKWNFVECGRIFDGNTDYNTKVKNLFDKPVKARYIRIHPETWRGWHLVMRAGAVLCETECTDKKLDYSFSNSLQSRTGGPNLDPSWGEGHFNSNLGYRFRKDKGLFLDASSCLKKPKEYSIIIQARLDQTKDWRALMSSEEWGDNGLYVNEKYALRPSQLECTAEPIRRNQFYKFGVTRKSDGTMTLFLNGYPCRGGSGKPITQDGFPLSPESMTFFQGPNHADTGGYVKRIQIWNKYMKDSVMTAAMGCRMPALAEACSSNVIHIPEISKYRASSVAYGYSMGQWYGRARLNSHGAWWARGDTRKTEWLQMDTGKVNTIAGVVTQGYRYGHYWVKTFRVKVSKDAFRWRYVECGRIFDGNTDYNTPVKNLFDQPVEARYIRIEVKTWHNWWIMMRAGVILCEGKCKGGELDWQFDKTFESETGGPNLVAAWGDGHFSHTHGYRFHKDQGFKVDESRCIKTPKTYSVLIEARLDQIEGFRSLMTTDAWNGNGLFVDNNYQLKPTDLSCIEPIRRYTFYKFGMTRTTGGNVSLFLNGYECAQGETTSSKAFLLDPEELEFFHAPSKQVSAGYVKRIQFWDKALTSKEMLAAASCRLAKQKGTCDKTVNVSPDDAKFRSNSIYANVPMGYYWFGTPSLGSRRGWYSYTWRMGFSRGAWLQMDLGKVQTVAGVVTRGHGYYGAWVTAYQVRISKDARKWYDVECGRIFTANKDQNSRVSNNFDKPVEARYVRVYPWRYRSWPAMRMGAILCEEKCKGKRLDYKLTVQSLSSRTRGPSLETPWGDGYFSHHSYGYRFHKNRGFEVSQKTCIDSNAWSGLFDVRFDQVSNYRAVLTSEDWDEGDKGFFIHNSKFELKPSGLECAEKIRHYDWYKLGITRTDKGVVTMFINGYPCATGKPTSNDGFKLGKVSQLFKGAHHQSSGGYVRYIKFWSSAMSNKTMTQKSGCNLALQKGGCKKTFAFAPDYTAYRAGDIYHNHGMGYYWYGQPQLSSNRGWYAYSNRLGIPNGNWLQMDLGAKQVLAGVVTRGHGYYWAWVYQYQVRVSNDGRSWKDVECGRIFDGNRNRHSRKKVFFDKPVEARYVRIYPRRYHGWIGMRMAALICESKCKGGKLDFDLKARTLNSKTLGPSLELPWGDGHFSSWGGYYFGYNRGFQVDPTSCVNAEKYSVMAHVYFHHTHHYRAVFSSPNWDGGDKGVYLHHGYYELKPTGYKCAERIRRNVWYKLGMTRTGDGNVTLYINGYNCATGTPKSNDGFKLGDDGMNLFKGLHSQSSNGYVKSIKFWNGVLTDKQMRKEAGCTLAAQDGSCGKTMVYAPDYRSMRARDIYGNRRMGFYWYGRPDLNYHTGWYPYTRQTGYGGEWLQIDLGKVSILAGMITRGHGYYWYHAWVTAYQLKVSRDGTSWSEVECGRIFDGNWNRHSWKKNMFDAAVKARYVRIYPYYYHYWPAMRAAAVICEAKCHNSQLSYNFQRTFNSATGGPSLETPWGTSWWPHHGGYHFHQNQGLRLAPGACVSNENKYTIIMKFRLRHVHHSRALITSKDWDANGLFVHRRILELKPSSLKCEEPLRAHYWYYIALTRTTNGEVKLYLNGAPCASGKPKSNEGYKLDKKEMRFFHGPHGQNSGGYIKDLKVFGKTLSDSDVAKECDCKEPKYLDSECDNDKTIVMSPRYKQYKATSFWYGGPMGSIEAYPKLNSYDAWVSRRNDQRQWLQIDTGKKQAIQGIVTQGRRRYNQWVKVFKITVSNDATTWKDVDCGRLFDGNKDRNTKVRNLFSKPIEARYIRIHPMEWHWHISMRAGVILCETKCKDKKLDYQMADFQSVTGGPNLESPWGSGQFIGLTYDARKDYPGYDIGGHRWWLSKAECDVACKNDPRCKGYVVGLWNNGGCWLKYEMTTNRRENRWIDAYFNVNTMWYNYKAPTGYKFGRNAGLQLNEKSCIKKGSEYTIIIEARPEETWGRRRILGSGGWGDKGAYIVDGRYEMYPSASGLSCGDYRIKHQFYYKFGITRSSKGEVKLYLNGYECASGSPTYADGYKLDTTDIQFFHDEKSHYSTWGYIRRIQSWGEALNATEMANASGCALSDTKNVDTCDKPQLFDATVKDIDFSGVRHRHDYGTGYGQGWALDQPGFWISSIDDIMSQWMQVDLGEVRTVTGVTTRGASDRHAKVTSYIVRTSKDGKMWTEVECGRIFYTEWKGYGSCRDENIDKPFAEPIAARFVRLYPVTWHNHIALRMQVNVCPKPKKEEKKDKKEDKKTNKKVAPITSLGADQEHPFDQERDDEEFHRQKEMKHLLARDAEAEREDSRREYEDEKKQLEARDERREQRLRMLEHGVKPENQNTLENEITHLI